MKNLFCSVAALLFLAPLYAPLSTAFAQGTAFTYQGRLNNGATEVTGNYDLRFALFDAVTSGTQLGLLLTNSATAVTNGLFTVALDFGNQFPGANRWLELAVRTNGNGAFTPLSPRQLVSTTPYAVYAANAGSAVTATTASSAGSVSAANITGLLTTAQLPAGVITNGAIGVNISGTFAGNGAGITNLNLSLNSGGAIYLAGGFILTSTVTNVYQPSCVAIADVNGDGKPDLISGNLDGGLGTTLSVLTNNGSGGFVLASSPVVGSAPQSVVAADVNGDGKPDLIVANNRSAGTLTVLTNNGSGNFALSASPVVGSHPASVAAADVNGDGKVDLISANSGDGSLTVLTNSGSGGFVLASLPVVGSAPQSVVAADVDGDGKPDLISANFYSGTLTVLTNNGSGNFVLFSSPVVGSHPTSVAAADVNGDGKVDLISANSSDGNLTVLTNNGSGGFVLASSPVVGSAPQSVVAADVNGDGRLDLICANADPNTLTVLTNNGSGGFRLDSTPGVGPYPVAVTSADVNGDGKVDLISANYNSLSILINSSIFKGTFSGSGSGLTGLNATNLVGTISAAQLPANLDSTTLSGQTSDGFWKTNGNTGADPANGAFIGTIDNQPLEFKVFGQRVLRLEPNNISPNVVGGYAGNIISNGLKGGVIAGGGYAAAPNRVGHNYATVVGGANNTASGPYSTAMGNSCTASGAFSTAMGANTTASGDASAALGYGSGAINSGSIAIGTYCLASEIYSTAIGYQSHAIGPYSTAIGCSPTASGSYSTAMGLNTLAGGNTAIALGYFAAATNDYTFVWADGSSANYFFSTGVNQFLIRASGGMGINKNNPATALDVNGTVTATSFSGSGTGLTSLNAANLTGTVLDARLSLNVALRSGGNAFTGNQTITGGSLGLGITPLSTLDVNGTARIEGANNWGVTGGEGDFRVGNDSYRFKIGVANGGGGAGDVWMRAHGGIERINIKAPGGTRFLSNEAESSGVSLAAGGTAWAVISDRNVKKDFDSVDSVQILEKLAAMPITQWHYKWETSDVTPHIGPMAQDFKAAFYPGSDDKSITTLEADGVAFAAIQGLNQKLKETRAENAELKKRLDALELIIHLRKTN